MSTLMIIAIGVAGGFASGILGIGGGTILVPLLVFGFGLTQHHAQGTTLAMLCLPAGLIAALQYQQRGYVDWKIALLLFAGFLIGGYLGSQVAVGLSQRALQRIFGATMIGLGIRMLLVR